MQVSNIMFNTNYQNKPVLNRNNNVKQSKNRTNIGIFPNYYCPNISFGRSIIDDADFQYDYYKAANDLIENKLDKLELTKDLSSEEQDDFKNNLFATDKLTLVPFIMDTKPSILLTGEFPYFQNSDKYDFVSRILNSKTKKSIVTTPNKFILNKELTKKTIDENKEIYTKRMNLDDNSSVDTIYKKLVGENSPLKEQYGFDDIIGITLGFSPINSVLFQLEDYIPDKIFSRRNPINHAQQLDEVFNSETSPYNNFSDEFKEKVQESIDFIKNRSFRKEDFTPIGYSYIQLAPDEDFSNKLIKDAQINLDKATEISNS